MVCRYGGEMFEQQQSSKVPKTSHERGFNYLFFIFFMVLSLHLVNLNNSLPNL